MKSKELAKKHKQYVIAMRRHFHENPEVSLKEFQTSQRIKEELEEMGIPYSSAGGTGIVAKIQGTKEGKTIALRADMDALQVQECTGMDFASKNQGLMHACGHDGHIAMLLGAAKILNEMKSEIRGVVKLFFQPAEELMQGARQMIADGVMEGVDGIFGIHLWSDIPVGKVSVEEGPRMAAADLFTITVTGKGGHGSLPHQGIDAVVVGSAIVMNLQSIVSRETSPLEPVVVSVGSFQAGTRFNVIGSEAILTGTCRTFSPTIRVNFIPMMERIIKSTAEAYRATAKLEYTYGTPPVINDPLCASIAEGSVKKLLGEEGLIKFEKLTGGEDLAEFMNIAPGALAFVGIKNHEKQCDFPHHHGKFNMDEEALEIGTALYAQYALDFLEE